jgi:HicA toxin of bacterial toxin-antitoxin,
MGKHEKTLAAVFSDPVRGNLRWKDLEAMLEYFVATITEGSGSRVRVYLNGRKAVFHRPHSSPDTDKGAIRSLREFLIAAKVML